MAARRREQVVEVLGKIIERVILFRSQQILPEGGEYRVVRHTLARRRIERCRGVRQRIVHGRVVNCARE
jgi:hypothetical protein